MIRRGTGRPMLRVESLMALDKNAKIMIVDDYRTMLRILRNLLRQLDFHNVEEASDGGEALRKLRGADYNLIISDWNMQPVTGLELLQTVRSDDKLKHIPFIMVTAESKIDNVLAAKSAGVNNYIVKPFTAEILKAKMASVLGQA